MSVTGAIMAGVGLAGSIGGAAISSNAAGNAASEQSQAAQNAAQLQYQASQNALNFQKQQYGTEQADLAPWLQSGNGALSTLDYLSGVNPQAIPGGTGSNAPTAQSASPYGARYATNATGPLSMMSSTGTPGSPAGTTGAGMTSRVGPGTYTSSISLPRPNAPVATSPTQGALSAPPASASSQGGFGSLLQPYSGKFSAPTLQDLEQNDPGYQARLKMGTQAMQQSAAARGNLLTGGTAQALNQLGQDYASNEYNNAYNRAYNTYASNYNQYEQGQANQYNRLASLAGVGQTAANQLGTLGNAASGQISSNLLNTAAQMGQQYNNAAAANASGIVGSANAWSGALGGVGNNLSQLAMLRSMYPTQYNGAQTLANQSNPYINGSSTLDPTISNYEGF